MGCALLAMTVFVGLLQGTAAAANGQSPIARFDWSRPDRYRDVDSDGFRDPANTLSMVNAAYTIALDACASDPDDGTITSYQWTVDGTVASPTADCKSTAAVATTGMHSVRLDITTSAGGTAFKTTNVEVVDLLVVSVGDSVASGEGNPHDTEYIVDTDYKGRKVQIPSDGIWGDERCHRSADAGPALAARHLEEGDAKSSITFIHVACSGAKIADPEFGRPLPPTGPVPPPLGGLLHPYEGIEPDPALPTLPPQLDQVADLVGSRKIDAMFMSIGANDLEFSGIVKGCLVDLPGCHVHDALFPEPDAIEDFERNLPKLPGLYDDLAAGMQAKLGSVLDADDVYITEYFDPMRCGDGTVCDPTIPVLITKDEGTWAAASVVPQLNQGVQAAADKHGWTFVTGIRDAYAGPPGHGYAADDSWVVSIEESLKRQVDPYGAFHPRLPGHRTYRNRLLGMASSNLPIDVPAPSSDVGSGGPPGDYGDVMTDRDGDAIPDIIDNCPTQPNANQEDNGNGKQEYTKHDGVGDACGFVVNVETGGSDQDLADGICDSGGEKCSLRAAIEQANHNGSAVISFSVRPQYRPFGKSGGPVTITASDLPEVLSKITFDGISQRALIPQMRCAPLAGHPCVELEGSGGTGPYPVLRLGPGSGGSEIHGFSIHSAAGHGIDVTQWAQDDGPVKIYGNYIGTDRSGALSKPNGRHGIVIHDAHDSRIGGPQAWQRNVIANSGWSGINVQSAPGVLIRNNHIGTNVAGTEDWGNGEDGITINTADVTVGGTMPDEGNLISGNGRHGVHLTGAPAADNVVQGNRIGTNISGASAIPNDENGVEVAANGGTSRIGGDADDAGNLIAFNRGQGVHVYQGTGHRILGNSIHTNGDPLGLGIDLRHSPFVGQVTLNDALDADTGTNGLQNFPAIHTVDVAGGQTTVTGFLHSKAATQYGIELYANSSCDPSRHGEAEKFLDRYTVTTDTTGVVPIDRVINEELPAGWSIAATATGPEGTSELSVGRAVEGDCVATYVVNSAEDAPDGDAHQPSNDGQCDTGSAAGGLNGVCTLRAAIQQSNASVGRDVIAFDLAEDDRVIRPAAALPTITREVLIDATTQMGYDGAPLVRVDGADAPSIANGLSMSRPPHPKGHTVEIRGLAITGFSNGVRIQGLGQTVLKANHIGVDGDGAAAGNSTGVYVDGSGHRIGAPGAGDGNVISGNTNQGVWIAGSANGNRLYGNRIGTNPAGTAAVPNGKEGVLVQGTSTKVGGVDVGERNIISGNDWSGVRVTGADNTVAGNYVGLSQSGAAAVPNSRDGVEISNAARNTIAGNVLSGNLEAGLTLENSGAKDNVVRGNRIGTNAAGTTAIGNHDDGVQISGIDNLIGGTAFGHHNQISGNQDHGVHITGAATTGNKLEGNLIGTDAAGAAGVPNANHGVFVASSENNVVGGPGSAGNTIAFNGGAGVAVGTRAGNAIRGNGIFSNTGLGIDLDTAGVTPNDAGDSDTGGNDLQNFPVVSGVGSDAGKTTVLGSLQSAADTQFTIDVYRNVDCDSSGHGEGQVHVGSATVRTGTTGTAPLRFTLNAPIPVGQPVTVTATSPGGDTSEFSACRTTVAHLPPATPTGFKAVPGLAGLTAASPKPRAHLSWSAPAAAPAVTGFDIRYNDGSGWRNKRLGPGVTTVTLSGLAAGKHHRFQLRAVGGGSTTSGWSPERTLTGTRVTASTSRAKVPVGGTVRVSGRLLKAGTTTGLGGRTVRPQFRWTRADGSWTSWSHLGAGLKTSSTGGYVVAHKPARNTQYRVVFTGAGKHLGAVSPARVVNVP